MDSFIDKNVKKIAVMGGTFDPIHYGHLVTAEAVRHKYNIDQVLFVPTGHPPHKVNKKISDTEHRYLMTLLATETNPYFYVSKIEINRVGYTYTIDTINELKKLYGEDTKIYFITGADAFYEILTWKNSEELLRLCSFVAATRPNYPKEELMNKVKAIKDIYQSKFHFIEVPALAISSSDIRERINQNRPIKYLLPEAVENYIYKYNLYRNKEN